MYATARRKFAKHGSRLVKSRISGARVGNINSQCVSPTYIGPRINSDRRCALAHWDGGVILVWKCFLTESGESPRGTERRLRRRYTRRLEIVRARSNRLWELDGENETIRNVAGWQTGFTGDSWANNTRAKSKYFTSLLTSRPKWIEGMLIRN